MKALFEPWGFMRMLRLTMGAIIMYQSFENHQPLLGLMGGFFVLQVLLNTGCGAAGCSPKTTGTKKVVENEAVDYEEIN